MSEGHRNLAACDTSLLEITKVVKHIVDSTKGLSFSRRKLSRNKNTTDTPSSTLSTPQKRSVVDQLRDARNSVDAVLGPQKLYGV